MANYDDVVEQNKKYLTQAQINALAAASKEYNVQNAGNRAGALASAREQLDVGYRGLQNMGLAGGLEAQATSGEVPRLQAQVQTNFDRYNQKLSDVEHQRLSALGANMAAQTQAARAAAAAAQRARMEAAGKLVANSLFDTSKKIGEGLVRAFAGIGVKKDIKATPTEQYDEPIGPPTQKQYMEQQQRQQQFNTTLAAAQVLGVSVPNLPAQIKGEKSSDAYKSAVVGAALESKKNPGKAWKTTPQDQKQARQNVNQSASVLATGTGYDTAADKQALTDAENRLSDLKWKRHYGGKVTDDELNYAQAAVNTARMKVEQPETYAALSVYNDPASKGTPAYKKAVGIIANEEAKALVKDVYGRDIDTKMTYDEFEAVGKDIKDLKKVIDRLDHAQKALEIAKENKLAPQSIAEDQKFIDDALADLKKLGYTEEEARDLVKNYANDRDARAEIEYYKNALYADMLNDGKRPTIGVNKNETDPTYRAVNHLPDIGDNNLVVVPGRLPMPSLQSTKTVLSSAEHMNESQRAAYNAIYEEEGIKAANEYATAIRPLTNIQQARDDESYAKGLVNDNVAMAVLSNLASVPVRAAGSIPAVLEKYIVGGLNAVNDEITGGAGVPMYIDTNSNAHRMTNFASSIRSETSRRIIESNKDDPVLGEWANRAYQIGMSMGDSAFNMALGIAVAPWMTGLLAGSDAANEAYKDARARGGTQNQALAMATASGIAENLFEQVSLEYFTNQWIKEGAAWTRPFIVKWALGAGVEGSEEVATSIANLLSDVYIMHDKSEWEQLVQEKGTKQAILDELKSLGWEGLGGAISGGVFGLFGGAFNGALKYADTTQLGKKAQSLGYTQKYQDMATVLGGKAEKTSAKLGTNPSAHQVGKLVNQVNNQLSSAFTGNEKTDIPMALMFSGKQLSFAEANDVYQALGSDTLKKMGYDAGSAREFMNSYNKRMVDSGIYSRVMQQQKERMENLGSAQAEEYLTSTEQLGGTEYGDKRNKWLQDAKKAAEEKVWKNPRMGLPVTTDAGEEVPVMPGNMTAVEFAEMQRKNFQARTTVTKGRATYELASMEARQGLTNEQAYNEMRGNLQDDMVSTADFYENLANNLGLDIVIHDVMPYTNGFLKDGKLHVVLGSRQNAVRIASHELTHYIKAFSPAKFNSLQTYLIADVGQEKFDKMVTEKAALYGFDTRKKSGLENAREEVCAELCERMLSNEQMLQRFAQKDTSTAKTMKEHLSQTLDTIKRVLNDQGDDFGKKSGLVKSVRTMDSWIDSLTSAIAAAEEQKKTMAGQVAVTAGVTEADHQKKNIRDRTAAITAQKTAEAGGIRYSIDTDAIRDAFTAVYQAALDGNQEQLRNLPAFLDSVSNGNTELRKALGDIFSKLPETTTKPATRRTQSKPAQARQPGMKPQGKDTRVRDVQVPEYAKTGDRVSDWVRSFFESDKASDEIVAQLMDKVQNGEWGTYTQLTNEDAMNQAKAYIAKKQFTEAQADFHAMVASGRYNVHTRALGLQLLTEAANRGDAAPVLDIATDLRTIATDAGQSLQILSVMKELGGVGAGWYMQKEIDRLNAQYADDISSGKMNEITVDPELMQQLIQASTQAEIEAAEDAIAEQVAAKLPLTFKSKIVNWRYLSMLGNPTTHFRNLTGNVFMSGLNAAKDVVATGIERVGVRDQSQRAHAVLDRNDRKMWKDIAARSFQEQEKNLRGSGKNGFGSFIQRHMRSFDNKTLNAIAQGSKNGKNVITKNGVMGMLEVEDVWFLRPAYQNAFMQYMKAQGFTVQDGVIGKVKNGQFTEISNVEMGKAIDWASQQAWKATFRDASTIASILNNASQKLGPVGHVLIEGVMPFKKTPVNIAKRGIEYSPVGVIMGGVQLMRDVKQGKMTAAQAIDNLASGVVGTSLMALGMAMAKAGLLRAGGEDKKKYETYLSDTGDQTYALKFGDVSLGVSALAPAAIPLLMGAALYDKITSDGEELDLSSVTETVAGTLDPFMEMSVVSSLNSALKNYNNNGIGGALGNTIMTAIQSYGSQFLPTVTGKVGQFIDPTVRTTKSSAASPLGANLDYYGRSLLKKVPGLEATLQPDVNVWGRETKKDGFTAWALDFANKFLLPFNVKISNRDVIDNELIRLVESTNDVNILPSDGSKYYTVKGKKYPMTAAQYTEFSKDRGNASYAAIKETMASAAYQNATTDEAKAYLLENALKAAQKQVDAVWKEKLGAIELDPDAKPAEGVKAIQGDYSDPALYKVAASYPNAYGKAAKAKSKGVSPDTFLDLYDKKETYIGDDRSDYMREQIMNSNLSTEQKELMDDLIVSDKGRNPDYSSNDWFEISMLGKTQYDEAKGGQKIGLNPNVYLAAYSKYKEANAKDKDGKYVHARKEAKKILKEYLDKLPVSAPVYDYIWTVVFKYKKQ